jgi:hypothetical protein
VILELYPWNYSNVIADTNLTGDSGWNSCSVGNCSDIQLQSVYGADQMIVFLNTRESDNPFRVYETMIVPNVDGQLKLVHVFYLGMGVLNIKEFVGIPGLPIRV